MRAIFLAEKRKRGIWIGDALKSNDDATGVTPRDIGAIAKVDAPELISHALIEKEAAIFLRLSRLVLINRSRSVAISRHNHFMLRCIYQM